MLWQLTGGRDRRSNNREVGSFLALPLVRTIYPLKCKSLSVFKWSLKIQRYNLHETEKSVRKEASFNAQVRNLNMKLSPIAKFQLIFLHQACLCLSPLHLFVRVHPLTTSTVLHLLVPHSQFSRRGSALRLNFRWWSSLPAELFAGTEQVSSRDSMFNRVQI